jgi:hypothetical protein
VIDQKLNSLRYDLINQGADPNEVEFLIDRICERARDIAASALQAGVSKAIDAAQQMKAKGFEGQIAVKHIYNGLEIGTDTGNLDFSTPPFPMLSKLLARGKTSKDGSTYRVIPIGTGASRSSTETVKDVSAGLDVISQTKIKRNMSDMMADMASSFGQGARSIVRTTPSISASNKPTFRIASSKQDANSKWVIPARQADLHPVIQEINSSMKGDIESAIDTAISELKQEIQDVLRTY